MTDAPELKSCPFCGGGARIYQDPSHSTAWFCGCEDWDCFGNMMWDETKTGATDKWNRRTDLSSPLGAVVKPLVWEAPCDANNWTHIARSFFGDYYVAVDGGRHQAWLAANEKPYERDIGEVVGTLAEAKALAEADYTARILAALKPPTHAALLAHAMRLPEVEAMVKALHFYADFHENPSDGPWGINSEDFGKVARTALKAKP